jgi:hypothetical protein
MTRPFVMPKSCNGVAVDEVCGGLISLSLSGAQIVIEMARFFALVQVRAARYRYGPRLTISSVARTAAQRNPISGTT